MKYRAAVMSLWIIGILFPMHVVRRINSDIRETFDFVFASHMSHVVMHAVLYAVLAYLLFTMTRNIPDIRKRIGLTLLVAICIAGLQEAVQVVTAALRPGQDEIFDIGVDLLGALLGLTLALRRHSHQDPGSP